MVAPDSVSNGKLNLIGGELFSQLNRLSSPMIVPKGTVLFERGVAAHYVFVIRSGAVCLCWQAEADLVHLEPTGADTLWAFRLL